MVTAYLYVPKYSSSAITHIRWVLSSLPSPLEIGQGNLFWLVAFDAKGLVGLKE
jgi:hypothetical protein